MRNSLVRQAAHSPSYDTVLVRPTERLSFGKKYGTKSLYGSFFVLLAPVMILPNSIYYMPIELLAVARLLFAALKT